jgi:putative SOS response-associated peptidase YedK
MAERRCLIPIDGFYEWQREGKTRRPYHFSDPQGSKLLLGGVFEYDANGQPCCAILTTAATGAMTPIHDRQPVLLPLDAAQDWLFSRDRAQLDSLIQPAPDDALRCWQVAPVVNDARHEGADCAAPLGELFPDAD